MTTIIMISIAVFAIVFGIYMYFKSKTEEIELEVELVPGSVDNVMEHFSTFKNVDVAGILGTDFLDRYGYIIDFNKGIIKHKLYTISFKEAMELLRIPFIVLWQNGKKYIFIIDTGSSNSHISSKAMNILDFEYDTTKTFTTVGAGGNVSSQGTVITKFYYR